ncbi:site-specific integrase [Rugamonas apoptosis]|uniref:Site-specific integrase n=1 Tax=Rugamonas apoptosis TaxID=2758570 RepID=A0A7W2F6P3_9BURK|nr:site-specific integrase [Rugamonas apoptosis]MBA5686079.1 site-specific integrase [Rugamonas apoptosis]
MSQNEFEFFAADSAESEAEVEAARKRREAWAKLDDELPSVVTLRSKSHFDPRPMFWSFADGVTYVAINFESLPAQVAPLVLPLKRVLIHTFEKNSPSYAVNLFRTFKRLALTIASITAEPVSEITDWHVSSFIGQHGLKDELGLASQLGALLSMWSKLQYRGLSDEAARLLANTKKKGNSKGKAVRTLDPVNGPFTDYELQQIVSALNSAYASNLIEEQYFYLTWLAILTGQRISQYCALKVKDLVRKVDEFGDISYEISIPKAKQREEVIRDSFLVRPLVFQFGEALWAYAQGVKAMFDLDGEEPLFPSDVEHRPGHRIGAGFEWHWATQELAKHYKEALSAIAPVSPRTMEPMNLAIGRFRDTIGTRAAQEGFGELVIAEILGHSDTQNIKAYIAAIPEIASRLDRLLGSDLAPIASAFLGRILSKHEDATRADDPASTIKDFRHSKEGFGSCGSKYDCKFRAPIACYTCFSFEAWLDGPHEKLLDHLEKERERLFVTSGPRVAAVNDLTIDAIRAVIRECNRIKTKMKEEASNE